MSAATSLTTLPKNHEYFVGIDSDGCVFDTMGIKQRECFCPMMIGHFKLQPVAEAARECKEFADLFSKTRGANRHKTMVRILDELLPGHPMVKERQFEVPRMPHYSAWANDPGSLLSDKGLQQAIDTATTPEAKAELEAVMRWSKRVNALVEEIVFNIPPFPYLRESLAKIQESADMIVCSQTPTEALNREWEEHGIANYPYIIAGQELGTKAEHLRLATEGKYEPGHVLMMGDAPGDYKAAQANNALFFPINPGQETASWKRFHEEGFDKFIRGEFAGAYQEQLLAEFDACLPEHPPWS